MSRGSIVAERCLIACCAHLSLCIVADEGMPVWLDVIRDVLPECDDPSPAVVPLRCAAEQLVKAEGARRAALALTRLRYEVQWYFAKSAAHRLEEWKRAKGGRV